MDIKRVQPGAVGPQRVPPHLHPQVQLHMPTPNTTALTITHKPTLKNNTKARTSIKAETETEFAADTEIGAGHTPRKI